MQIGFRYWHPLIKAFFIRKHDNRFLELPSHKLVLDGSINYLAFGTAHSLSSALLPIQFFQECSKLNPGAAGQEARSKSAVLRPPLAPPKVILLR